MLRLHADDDCLVKADALLTTPTLELKKGEIRAVWCEFPWSGQSCFFEERYAGNLFEYSIIPVVKKKDGTFVYDYTKMQWYIDLCAKYGINREISLYGFANIWCAPGTGFQKIAVDYPDGIRLRYLDEKDDCYKHIDRAADINAYIRSLEQYFITTGQMEKVRLAADEPADIEAYRASLGHLQKIAPAFKCKAAINHAEFIPEFGEEVSDFVPFLQSLSKEYDKICEYKCTLEGKRFQWYVCCGPAYPNTFLRSNLTESCFIGVLTSYAGLGGGRYEFRLPGKEQRAAFDPPIQSAEARHPSVRAAGASRGTGDSAALETAYNFVVREKDIRKYYTSPPRADRYVLHRARRLRGNEAIFDGKAEIIAIIITGLAGGFFAPTKIPSEIRGDSFVYAVTRILN